MEFLPIIRKSSCPGKTQRPLVENLVSGIVILYCVATNIIVLLLY